MKLSRKGFTLIETIIAASIFSFLLVTLFMVYRTGADAWMKSDANSELLGKAQVLTSKISRAVERSSYQSLAINRSAPDAVSFLSPLDSNGVFQYDSYRNRPLWQEYLFFYRDRVTGDVRVNTRSVVGTPAEITPLRVGPTSWRRQFDLTPDLVGGKLLVDNSVSLDFRILPVARADRLNNNERLEMTLVVQKEVRGRTDPRTLESRTIMKFRN